MCGILSQPIPNSIRSSKALATEGAIDSLGLVDRGSDRAFSPGVGRATASPPARTYGRLHCA